MLTFFRANLLHPCPPADYPLHLQAMVVNKFRVNPFNLRHQRAILVVPAKFYVQPPLSSHLNFLSLSPMKHLYCVLLFLLYSFTGSTQNLMFQKQLQAQNLPAGMRISLFVDAPEQALKKYLQSINGTYKYAFRNYHHITVPASQIKSLAQQTFIKHIDYHYQKPVALNDSMRVKARVNQVHQGLAPLPQGYRGKGVIVGLIDDGIDFRHPDLQDSSGNTRVLAIWDQTQSFSVTRTPSRYGYGQQWDSTDINAGICTSVDNSGHGTTVTGTAAGNGLSTGTHAGVAPESWIVMVKSNFSLPNWEATVADAADYIYYLADSLQLPCVINASVGDYYGPHDGSDLPSQYIDSLVRAKRGRLFVAALGNSGTFPPYHLETNVTSDTSFTWFNYNAPGGGDAFPYGSVFFEAFADTADMQNVWFSVGADRVSPTFQHRGQGDFFNAFDFLGSTVTDTIISSSGNILGIVDYYAEVLNGGILSLQVHMKEPDSTTYKFRFSSTGTGRFDVWSAEWLGISNMVNNVPTAAVFPDIVHYVSPDSAKTMVNGPQCLESVVTVANYNNIQNYIGYDGAPVNLGEVEGDICSTSSRGPTRDNRQKPDVAATGNVTFSPGPLDILTTLISVAPFKLLPDGMHMRNGGTSMASPVVAGIGALFLERCPQMGWEEFKEHINTSAYTDSHTGAVPNISFGYGKVSAYDAIVQTVYAPTVTADTAICEGDVAELLAPMGYQEYTWSNGDNTYFSETDSTSLLWVTGVTAAGCKTDTTFIQVNEYPIPEITISSPGGLLTAGSSVAGVTYQWYHNGMPISGANSSTYAPVSGGPYFVTGTDGHGCTGYSDTLSISGIPESELFGVKVFPNPFENYLEIVSLDDCAVEVRNSLGELMLTTGKGTIYTSNWASGLYLLKVSNSKGAMSFKIVKQ